MAPSGAVRHESERFEEVCEALAAHSVVEPPENDGRSLLFHSLAPHALADRSESDRDQSIGLRRRNQDPASLLVRCRLGASIGPGPNVPSAERASTTTRAR